MLEKNVVIYLSHLVHAKYPALCGEIDDPQFYDIVNGAGKTNEWFDYLASLKPGNEGYELVEIQRLISKDIKTTFPYNWVISTNDESNYNLGASFMTKSKVVDIER